MASRRRCACLIRGYDMKIIGTTKNGFLAELSATEANKLSGSTPAVGETYNPLDRLNRADWINTETAKLALLRDQLSSFIGKIDEIVGIKGAKP